MSVKTLPSRRTTYAGSKNLSRIDRDRIDEKQRVITMPTFVVTLQVCFHSFKVTFKLFLIKT